MFRSLRHLSVTAGLLLASAGVDVGAQTITGVTANRGGFIVNTIGVGGTISNVFITAGTNPTTDSFLYNGNAAGFFPNLDLSPGDNTFHLWGVANIFQPFSGVPDVMVSLFAGGDNTTPVLTAIYDKNGFIAGTGGSAKTNAEDGAFTPAAGLSAILGGKQVTIVDWSSAQVTRNVSVGQFAYSSTTTPVDHFVGKLVLRVEDLAGTQPPSNPVPEPGTLALLATGLAGIVAVRRRERC